MRFRIRNIFYLRLSSSDVIPLYVYLDERHVDWMSERTLQSVVADLRRLVGPKLEAERHAHYGPGGPASAKKGTVEVHRGDTYQFAYFLRKADPHSVVLKVKCNRSIPVDDQTCLNQCKTKTRNYTMVNRPIQPESAPLVDAHGKRNNSNHPTKGRKRPRKATQRKPANKKGKGKARATDVIEVSDSEEEAEESNLTGSDDTTGQGDVHLSVPRRSVRNKKQKTDYRIVSDDDENEDDGNFDKDVRMDFEGDQSVQVKQEITDENTALRNDAEVGYVNDEELGSKLPLPPEVGIDEDEEEKKLKPELQLSFRSLNMPDRCLCVVVEPWPALPSRTTHLSAKVANPRDASLAPPAQGLAVSSAPTSRFSAEFIAESFRKQTPVPLFLPDPSGRDSATPGPMRFASEFSTMETFEDTQESIEDDDDFGMLAFSQVLNSVSGDRTGTAEEDDEMDGGALYGDADEIRGVI